MAKDSTAEDMARVLRDEYKVITVKIPEKAYAFIQEALGKEEVYEDFSFGMLMSKTRVHVDGEVDLLLGVSNGGPRHNTPLLEVSLVTPITDSDEIDVDTKIFDKLPIPDGIELTKDMSAVQVNSGATSDYMIRIESE